MRDEKLLYVSRVVDDSTGIWQVGELEFGVYGTCTEWLKNQSARRDKLADWLQMLADACRNYEAPFGE